MRSTVLFVGFLSVVALLVTCAGAGYQSLDEIIHQKIHGLYVKLDQQHAEQMAEIAKLRNELAVRKEIADNQSKVALLQAYSDCETMTAQLRRILTQANIDPAYLEPAKQGGTK